MRGLPLPKKEQGETSDENCHFNGRATPSFTPFRASARSSRFVECAERNGCRQGDHPESRPSAGIHTPRFLHEKGVRRSSTGGMGATGARHSSRNWAMETILGVSGNVDDVIEPFPARNSLTGGPSLCLPGAGKGYGVRKGRLRPPPRRSSSRQMSLVTTGRWPSGERT